MVEIKSTENASDVSNHDPTVGVSMRFMMHIEVASSHASNRDPTVIT